MPIPRETQKKIDKAVKRSHFGEKVTELDDWLNEQGERERQIAAGHSRRKPEIIP